MKKFKTTAIGILLFSLFLPPVVFSQKDPLTTSGTLRVLNLAGTPFERGWQHGQALKKDIHALVKLWKADITNQYKTDPDEFIKKFLANTDFPKAVKKWTPELMEEVRGISEGAGIDYDTMFAFQLVDEMWVLGREIVSGDHCTTIGTNKTSRGPAMVSQTLDIPTFYHGFQTLLHIKEKDSDLETMLFTFPGFIAANGLNSASVAVVVNAVQQLAHSRNGLPVAFVIRGLLQKRSFKDAVKFIRSLTFGSPQNYMIGGLDRIASFECSANNIEEFLPFPEAQFTYHTNHPLKNKHFTPQLLETFRSKNIEAEKYQFRCKRFASLQKILPANDVDIDVELLKEIYKDRETIINNPRTFGVTIMVLGKNPKLLISPGRPDETQYQIFDFNK